MWKGKEIAKNTNRPVIDGLSVPVLSIFCLQFTFVYVYLRTCCISIKVNVPVGGLLSLFQEIDRKKSLIIDPLQQQL